MQLLAAQRHLSAIEIIAEHADLSDRALDRICFATNAIRAALDLKRQELGLQPRCQVAA